MRISAGTRNHFALDLGLDRDDPSRCLEALTDGVGLLVDLGFIGGRPFVNNASFGAHATVVQSPDYRADKAETTLEMLPELLAGHHGPRLMVRAGSTTIDGPRAVLVSNNPYGMGDVAGLGRRAHRTSRSEWTVRRCRSQPRCAAPCDQRRCRSGFLATVQASRCRSPRWTGGGCDGWP